MVVLVALPMLALGGPTGSATASPIRATTPQSQSDPTDSAIPAVVDAVQAARLGAPIPSPLIPPLQDLHGDQYPPIPDCWALRDEPHHLDKCTLFADGATKTIVLIGDSHAREWLPPIASLAQRDGWAVIPLWRLKAWQDTFIPWAEAQVRAVRPDVVLIGRRLHSATKTQIDVSVKDIRELATAAEPYAGHVVLIGDPPALSFQPPRCLGAPGATLGTCTSALTPDQITVLLGSERAAKDAGASFLRTIGWFCYQDLCPAVVGHMATYREDDHISRSWGRRVRGLFRTRFVHAISP